MIAKRLQRARQAALYLEHLAAGVGSGLLLFALLAFPAQAADPRESAPRSLVIAYHTAPANRLAFRQERGRGARGALAKSACAGHLDRDDACGLDAQSQRGRCSG
jgi:hypothetical protein